VAVKSGRSRAGARAASSHTGALAASDAVVDALFRQAGVIRTATLEEFFDVATLLAHQPVPRGRRVAILTNAGGPAILAADACEAHGLELPPLSSSSLRKLREFLPQASGLGNPVDMLASAPPEHYRRSLEILLADRSVDSVLVIFIPPLVTQPEEVAAAIVEGARHASAKPVLSIFMSAKGAPPILSSIPSYAFPESAGIALARASAYGEWRRRPPGEVAEPAGTDRRAARAVVEGGLARGGGWLDPLETQSLLASFGIAVAPIRMARQEEEVLSAAREVGFPVVLKAVGPTILHKTEVGGVRLDLADEEGVRRAFRELTSRLGDSLTDVLVQKMVAGGVEVIAGVTQDPTFGPLILYGSGGTLVELLADVAFRLQPVTDRDIAAMLEEVRGTALLRGFRGAPPADEGALRDLLARISALVDGCPELLEMDLNPVKVLTRGVCVVDARIRIGRRPSAAPSRRIAY
jgi:acyl-CoA synthetase (NDP forming)